MDNNYLSVRQLNLYVRSLIDGDARLSNITVAGEISNFKNHYASGHLYFTLKDKDAAIRCVMFKGNAMSLKFTPSDGIGVVVRGRVSIYEKDGQYQLYAEEMLPSGQGDITAQFEKVKAKLQAEGMFDIENKRSIPKFPRKIAVVTSETGAAVQDIFNILSRRWPLSEVIFAPVSVQGDLAVPQMINALNTLYEIDDIDVGIIGRGGGSIEDLWAFNDELLARKIYESPFPIISAVGHETDFTICDFVSDLRAPTPSAAAELAVPDIKEVSDKISKYRELVKKSLKINYEMAKSEFEQLSKRYVMCQPQKFFVEDRAIILDKLTDRLKLSITNQISGADNRFCSLVNKLDTLSPLKVLSRGYAIAAVGKKTVKSVSELSVDNSFDLHLSDGYAECTVNNIVKEH